MEAVNGLTKKVPGDLFDEWKRLAGHSFTAGFVIESLRTNDTVYKKLHGDRPIKDVSFLRSWLINLLFWVSKSRKFGNKIAKCSDNSFRHK